MSDRIANNKQFITDLFVGDFRGHGVIMEAEPLPSDSSCGDVSISDKPVDEFVDLFIKTYEKRIERHLALEDDSVPYASPATGTECFAAAFGCPVHVYDDSPPCALSLVSTPEEADRLFSPGLDAEPMQRILEAVQKLRDRLGPDVPISVPDMQSPFDIAALIWRKEDLFIAMCDAPDSVKRLTEECYNLQTTFIDQLMKIAPNCSLCHCPQMWTPPEMGAWVSEDEAGSLSVAMFEEFCLPTLQTLSNRYGGISLHCCATADHQYASFRKIPKLRGLNRVFQTPGSKPAIDAFAGETVLITAWFPEEFINEMLDLAVLDSRFMFTMPYLPDEEAKAQLERLMKRIGRA